MGLDKTGIIRQTKTEALKSFETLLEMIENNDTIDSAEALRETELKIVAATDKIAGKLIEAVVTNVVNDEHIVKEGKKLIKNSPARMKNHGKRDVVIHPYRGDSFTVRTTYCCRAGLSPTKGLKKRVSIPS